MILRRLIIAYLVYFHNGFCSGKLRVKFGLPRYKRKSPK